MALSNFTKAFVQLKGDTYRRTEPDIEQAYFDRRWSVPIPVRHLPNSLSQQPKLRQLTDEKNSDIEVRYQTSCESFTSTATTIAMNATAVELPVQRYPYEWMNKLRWQDCLIYHRISALIIFLNLTIVSTYWVLNYTLWLIPIEQISTALAANILLTVITRNEIVVNLLFLVFGCLSQRLPLRLRRMAAKVYHFGGMHSGAAFSAALWLVVLNSNVIHSIWEKELGSATYAMLATTMMVDLLIIAIIGTSMPRFRFEHHNIWECTHRYGGWSLLALFWAQFGLLTHESLNQPDQHMMWAELLIKSPLFWLLLIITLCIVWPWLSLRKVRVKAEPLSKHAIQLHFDYTNIAFCVAPRLSDNPWREWHSFAAIPHQDGFGYSVIVSKSGDWTSKIIANPPEQLWIRSIPIRGVLHVAPIFKSMILVATGSGIGPVLSLLYARKVKCRILWSTKSPLETFREGVCKQVRLADPDAVIIDTTAVGHRPNLVEEAYKLYRDLDAEAVFVISNARLSKEMVYSLESRGVPCFAPIFDS